MTPIQTVDSVYEAFRRGDVPYILSLVAPNAQWHASKGLPWGGEYVGPAGAAEFFTRLSAAAQTTGFAVRESFEVGLDVFSFGTYRCMILSTGKPAAMEWMFRWRVESGMVTNFYSYIDSAAVLASLT